MFKPLFKIQHALISYALTVTSLSELLDKFKLMFSQLTLLIMFNCTLVNNTTKPAVKLQLIIFIELFFS